MYIYIPTRWCIIVCKGWTRFMLMVEQSRVIGVYKSTYNWGLCRLHIPILFGSWCQFLQTEDLGKIRELGWYFNLGGPDLMYASTWNSGQIDFEQKKHCPGIWPTGEFADCRLRQNCRLPQGRRAHDLGALGSLGSVVAQVSRPSSRIAW